MNKREFKELAQNEIGELDLEVLEKAIKKLQRSHMQLFGCVDYQEEADEGFGNLMCFYHETVSDPEGRNTYNRQIANSLKERLQ